MAASWRRSLVQEARDRSYKLCRPKRLRNKNAVGYPVCGPIFLVRGDVDNRERRVFLSYLPRHLPSAHRASKLHVRYQCVVALRHEQSECFFAGRDDFSGKPADRKRILQIGL